MAGTRDDHVRRRVLGRQHEIPPALLALLFDHLKKHHQNCHAPEEAAGITDRSGATLRVSKLKVEKAAALSVAMTTYDCLKCIAFRRSGITPASGLLRQLPLEFFRRMRYFIDITRAVSLVRKVNAHQGRVFLFPGDLP